MHSHTRDTNRLKGSEADMQGDLDSLYSPLTDAVEDFRGEMKTGGWGGDRSALLGINGLIALPVAGGIRARDVRRQRDVSNAIQKGEEIGDGLKANAALSELAARKNFGLQLVVIALTEEKAFTDADLAARAYEAFPIIGLR